MKPYKLAVLSAVAAGSLWSLNASAQLSYNQGDLLLGLRNPGAGNDLIVDIGPASQYVNATGPITISGTYYTPAQFTASGLDFNNLYFSVFGDTAGNTLWATANAPLVRHTSSSQSVAAGKFEAIAQGAADAGSFYTANAANSSSAVITPNGFSTGGGTDLSYTKGVLDPNSGAADFQYFSAVNEANTTPGFNTSPYFVTLNLYELDPYSNNTTQPPGTQLGYFELDSNGTLTFDTGVAPVPEPGTWAMFGAGMLALGAIRRFRRTV
jgi:hypothetical protein